MHIFMVLTSIMLGLTTTSSLSWRNCRSLTRTFRLSSRGSSLLYDQRKCSHFSSYSGRYNVEGDVERRVYRWLLEVVYGMGLCPWSGTVLQQRKGEAPRLHIKSDTNIDITRKGLKHFGTTLMKNCEELAVKKNGTTLLVCPALVDFEDFLAVAEFADELLEQSGMDKQIQIATFHPDYLFDGEDEETSLTNRSPYPMLHLLRVEDVREAIESYEAEGKSTDEVWQRNKAFVEKRGDQIRLILEKILSDI